MKTISHKDLIRLPAWNAVTFANAATLNGYCPDHAEVARGRGEPEAWATYAGAAICGDKGYYEAQLAKAATAITLEDGERVTIEGGVYSVKVMPGNRSAPRNSDPTHFVPA